jgi:hypothetical protein
MPSRMHKHLLSVFALSLLAAACGNAGIPNPTFADDEPATVTAKAKPAKPAAKPDIEAAFLEEMASNQDEEVAETAAPPEQRHVGDRTVSRISGSFTKNPMTFTEEVVAQAGTLVVVDYTLDEGKHATRLRVTHDSRSGRVLRVREMHGTKELPSSVDAYQAMMDKTAFTPDDNEAQIGKEKAVCLIGTQSIDCEKTAYRVKIGDKSATFSVARSDDGQDISGEIADNDGKIIYKAEVVDTRKGTPSGVASR